MFINWIIENCCKKEYKMTTTIDYSKRISNVKGIFNGICEDFS